MFSTPIILCLSFPIFLSVDGTDASPNVIKNPQKIDMGIQLLPYSVYSCNSETLIEADMVLYPDQEGFAVNITVDREINNKFLLVVKVDMFENGQWMENYFNSQGDFCEMIDKYVKGGWNKMAELIQPKIQNKCIIKPNQYVLPKTHFTSEDLEIRLVMKGKIRAEAKLFTPENEELFCTILEANLK